MLNLSDFSIFENKHRLLLLSQEHFHRIEGVSKERGKRGKRRFTRIFILPVIYFYLFIRKNPCDPRHPRSETISIVCIFAGIYNTNLNIR